MSQVSVELTRESVGNAFAGRRIIYWIVEYYPTRFNLKELPNSENLEFFKKVVWNFKDGGNTTEIANAVKTFLPKILKDDFNGNKPHLCIIPASTQLKTKNRFKQFCQLSCGDDNIQNGYDLIKSNGDREHARGGAAVDIIEQMEFGDVKDKHILLFDDVYTTGKSFRKVSSKLEELGAASVIGLFLGKTHWLPE